jgi:hypothetical protein
MTLTPEQIAEEEARAALWREQTARRAAYQAGLWQSLSGSPAAREQLLAAWAPVILWLGERDDETDPEDDYGEDPLLSEIVNVGRLAE